MNLQIPHEADNYFDKRLAKRLSSDSTYFYAKILPTFVIFMSGFGAIMILLGVIEVPIYWRIIAPVVPLTVGIYFQKTWCQIKEVWLIDSGLVVIDLKNRKTFTFTWQQIAEIAEISLSRPERIIIRFKTASDFGIAIWFIPPLRLFGARSHPVWSLLSKLHLEQTGVSI